MQPTRNWWTYYENPIYLFPDPTIYALRGIIDLEKVPIEILKILSSSQVLFCHGREHHLVLDIFHSQFFLLLFFCYKELGFCLLHIDWLRRLLCYYAAELHLKDT